LRSLARSLTEAGVPTRSIIESKRKLDAANADPEATDEDKANAQDAYGTAMTTPWSTRTIRDILSNPRYAGWILYQREIMVDDDGNRMCGDWDALVDPDDFDVIQARLADPARKSTQVGTHRRYLGSALFLCDECGGQIETVNGGRYTCNGQHKLRSKSGGSTRLMRDHAPVDEFVIEVIAERLSRPDFADLLAPDKAEVKPLTDAARKLRRRIEISENDYAAGDISAKVLKKTQATITAELSFIESKLAAMTSGAALGNLAAAADPAAAFRTATVMGQRAIIDALAVVRLQRVPRGRPGRGRTFDTSTVIIEWKY
ncbi:MAG: recombinase family protein, partial [Candidatus Nanopelagicales bacterium]